MDCCLTKGDEVGQNIWIDREELKAKQAEAEQLEKENEAKEKNDALKVKKEVKLNAEDKGQSCSR